MAKGFSHVIIERSGHTVRVTFGRPPVNALNHQLVEELHGAAKLLRRDKHAWVVFLTTGLSHFSAGADLKERSALRQSKVSSFVGAIQRMVLAWYHLPQPVVVGIRGGALGGGLELALAGDILIASDDATLGFPEVRLGIIPAACGTQLLTARTEPSTANRWILTGSRATAAVALRDGVVDYVVPARDFSDSCGRILEELSAGAPLAMRGAKQALRAARRDALQRGLAAERAAYRALITTRDRAEALKAFLEKRTPQWTGR